VESGSAIDMRAVIVASFSSDVCVYQNEEPLQGSTFGLVFFRKFEPVIVEWAAEAVSVGDSAIPTSLLEAASAHPFVMNVLVAVCAHPAARKPHFAETVCSAVL